MKPILQVRFTNGVGNNIFQYVYARLLAEHRGMEFKHPQLGVLSVLENDIKKFPTTYQVKEIRTNGIDKIDYHGLFSDPWTGHISLKAYPEDFILYTPIMGKIRSWFPKVKTTNTRDLVLHLRMGDRLQMQGCFKNKNAVAIDDFIKGIHEFSFGRLHIVTDMPEWKPLTEKEFAIMRFHRDVVEEKRASVKQSVDYWNHLFDGLSTFDPIVRAGHSIVSDFEYMRGFKKIMLQHGTLAWWAAALGNADQVSVYGPWRGAKSINLGWTDLPGWKQWGRATAPIPDVKLYHLKGLANKFGLKTFVETGTRGGTTLFGLENEFDRMHSVEIIQAAYEKVFQQVQYKKLTEKISLYLGDSAEELKKILLQVNAPTLFWLDAHDGRNSTPILKELDLILPEFFPHVLVIDDSRYFGTEEAYPTIDQIRAKVKQLCPKAYMDIKFDSIRIFMGGKPCQN